MKQRFYKNALSIIAVLLIIPFCLAGCKQKGISAEQWIINQYDSLDLIELFCKNMDQVVSLYISGSISQKDFLVEMETIEVELSLMESQREIEEIKTGSLTYETKLAKEGYEGVWEDLRIIVDSLRTDENLIQNTDQMAYFYMAYSEDIAEKLDNYADGYQYALQVLEE